MDKSEPNRVRDARETFDMSGAASTAHSLVPGAKAHRLKVFKSGNSLALRLPKALGMEAGMELELSDQGGGTYALRPALPRQRKFDIDAIWGIGADLGLQPITPEDRLFDEVRRPWDEPDWPGLGEDNA